jgi:hypothetical protein
MQSIKIKNISAGRDVEDDILIHLRIKRKFSGQSQLGGGG